MLSSPINPTSARADLIRQAAIVIWDEAPMANRAVLAAVDEVCRRIMGCETPFGGKVIILLGDFRQTCPVVRYGSRAQVIDASIKSSPLWPLFTVLPLVTAVRNAADPEYAAFVDAIGDGAGPDVDLSILPRVQNQAELRSTIYPAQTLREPIECATRAILAPTNRQVDAYNDEIMDMLEGDAQTYLAADLLKETENNEFEGTNAVLDYAASRTITGLPSYQLRVKIGCVCRLLRNFSLDRALVKNVRGVVKEIGQRLITLRMVRMVSGHAVLDPEDVLIPRITFEHTLRSRHTLLRRQFPLALAYATTFNSCQGLTLDRVGVDLTHDVFSHGQLYTALSRIRRREDGYVLLQPDHDSTTNVTFIEI